MCNAFKAYISTWTMGINNIEAIRNITEVGFKHVELWPEIDMKDKLNALNEVIESYGIRVWSLHAPFSGLNIASIDEELRNHALTAIIEYIHYANKLNASVVVVHPSSGYAQSMTEYSKGLEKLKNSLRILAKEAVDNDIMLALENMIDKHKPEKSRIGAYVLELKSLINEMNLENVGICLDTGHSNINKMIPAVEAYWAADNLITIHMNDNLGITDDHLIPTEGNINWKEFINALKLIKYRGPLVMEINSKGTPLKTLLKLREICKKLGLTW